MKRVPAPSPRSPDIQVHIDRLVLRGIDVRDRGALGAAVQGELARLLAERGWNGAPTAPVVAEHVRGGTIRMSGRQREAALGSRIAAAVHRGLTQ